jgi:hypothetical protein
MWGGGRVLPGHRAKRLTKTSLANRWLSVRFNLISSCIIGVTGFVAVASPTISASLAGFALAFASTITNDVRDPNLFCIA